MCSVKWEMILLKFIDVLERIFCSIVNMILE